MNILIWILIGSVLLVGGEIRKAHVTSPGSFRDSLVVKAFRWAAIAAFGLAFVTYLHQP